LDATPSGFAFSSVGNPENSAKQFGETAKQFGETAKSRRQFDVARRQFDVADTTVKRAQTRKTTTLELPKKGRLQSLLAKMTRAICVLRLKEPSYIWRDPMTETCAPQSSAQFGK
jgi:hypothetical protein